MTMRIFFFIGICGMFLAGCQPRIYSFTVDPPAIGNNDPVRVSWKVAGKPTLLIHDIDYPGSGGGGLGSGGGLSPITLVIKRHGKEDLFTLTAADTIRLPLGSESDSLEIRKKPDGHTDDRLRYFRLVAVRGKRESPRTIEVPVRPDTAGDQVGFPAVLHEDTLIAAGIYGANRWGGDYSILTVADTGNRVIEVTHANISRVLHRGDPPDDSLKGTPVSGYWILRTLLTPEDKANRGQIPKALNILIVLKHR
jgi:hypothetical protein